MSHLSYYADMLNDQRAVSFCLLEQYLPDGDQHPFAQKMIHHFEKLSTPLRNIKDFPHLSDLERRFRLAGWPSIRARSLWEVYCDANLVPPKSKFHLNRTEVFDEWEEFILFASHYFILVASKRPSQSSNEYFEVSSAPHGLEGQSAIHLTIDARQKKRLFPGRRFGAITAQANSFDHHGGLGPQSRTDTSDTYLVNFPETQAACSEDEGRSRLMLCPNRIQKPEPRMCHTITPFAGDNYLLVGGRRSPDQALRDCWEISKSGWHRMQDLPVPLFRHCASRIKLVQRDQLEDAVLVYGGKVSSQKISGDFFVWRRSTGWMEVSLREGSAITPRFGASMSTMEDCEGIILGGMSSDECILDENWRWSVLNDNGCLRINLKPIIFAGKSQTVCNYTNRFGAVLESSSMGLFLIGGVADQVIPQHMEVLRLSLVSSDDEGFTCHAEAIRMGPVAPRPLLVGHSACSMGDHMFIVGGGAVCFSFGSVCNTFPLVVSDKARTPLITRALIQGGKPPGAAPSTSPNRSTSTQQQVKAIEDVRLSSEADFASIISQGRPVIIRGEDLGSCITYWQSLDYLKEQIGAERPVVVHDSSDDQMNFLEKNFRYVKKPFGQFVDEVGQGAKQYLRSLAYEDPAASPANVAADFPQLAEDFQIPKSLQLAANQMHSSVLRISGPVKMWLHYDVLLSPHFTIV